MTIKLLKIELIILGLLQKGIGGRLIRVENNKEEKLVCPMNLYELNASLDISEDDLTEYIKNLKILRLVNSAIMQSQNLMYYWISNEGIGLLNNYDAGNITIKLNDDKYFKKLLIEKSINIIRDIFFDGFYKNDNDLNSSLASIDNDISEKIIFLLNSSYNYKKIKKEINNLLDEQAKRYELPSLNSQELFRKYKKLSANHLLPLNDKELIEFKEYIKKLTELKSTFLFSKDQSELHTDYSAFLITSIQSELAKNVFNSIKKPFIFGQDEKLFLHLTISKYAYLPDIFYVARLLVENNQKSYPIGYTVANNFRYIFSSVKNTLKGKKKLYSNINIPLKRFNLILDEKYYFIKI